MHWYEGTMADAVNLSKQRNTIFVVFVEGDNDLSKDLAATIDNSHILQRLSDPKNFLAVKLKSGSENYTYFAQIYQFVPVPSLFFIGRNGTPLEVVCAGVDTLNLATRIDKLLQEHHNSLYGREDLTLQPSTSSQEVREETNNFIQSEAAAQSISAVPIAVPQPESKPEPPKSNLTYDDEFDIYDGSLQRQQPNTQSQPRNLTQQFNRSNGPLAQPANFVQAGLNTQVGSINQVGPMCQVEPRDQAEPINQPKPKNQAVTKEQAGSKGQTVPIDQSGPKDEVEPKDQVRSKDQVGPQEQAEPQDQAASVDQGSPKDQAEPSQSSSSSKEAAPVESDVSIKEKMERAKELIEIRRREKEAKEKEEEKQKEKERRAVGQGVAELKKWQADQELKQIQEERKREKMENNLARQRILDQIAQDRAERKSREQPHSAPAAPATPPPAAVGDAESCVRVQFRLPDGETRIASFPADAPLSDVLQYVADNLNLRPDAFSLWTAFPRRELVSPAQSLAALRLAPAAALHVMLRCEPPPPAHVTPFAAIFAFISQIFLSFVLEPTYQFYSWLRNRIFPTPTTQPTPATSPTPTPHPTPTPPPTPQNTQQPPNQGVRKRGNIHRLPSDNPEDDENNTWNGNSTQQM